MGRSDDARTGFYTRSQVRDGKAVENRARFTFVYARRDGEWRIVTHQSSPVL